MRHGHRGGFRSRSARAGASVSPSAAATSSPHGRHAPAGARPTAACILIRRSRRSYECPQSITCPSAMIGGRVAWTLPSRAVIQTKVGLMAYLALAWAAPLHPRAAEAHRRVDLSVSRHDPSLVTLSSFATRRGAVEARPQTRDRATPLTERRRMVVRLREPGRCSRLCPRSNVELRPSPAPRCLSPRRVHSAPIANGLRGSVSRPHAV
jgi:hypothetical protein